MLGGQGKNSGGGGNLISQLSANSSFNQYQIGEVIDDVSSLMDTYGSDLKIPYILNALDGVQNLTDGSTLSLEVQNLASEMDGLLTFPNTTEQAFAHSVYLRASGYSTNLATQTDVNVVGGIANDIKTMTGTSTLNTTINNATSSITSISDLITLMRGLIDDPGTSTLQSTITQIVTSLTNVRDYTDNSILQANIDAILTAIASIRNYTDTTSTLQQTIAALNGLSPSEQTFLDALMTRAASTASNIALNSDILDFPNTTEQAFAHSVYLRASGISTNLATQTDVNVVGGIANDIKTMTGASTLNTTVNGHTTDIAGIRNMTGTSILNTTVNAYSGNIATNTAAITAINNMTGTTTLNTTIGNNAYNIEQINAVTNTGTALYNSLFEMFDARGHLVDSTNDIVADVTSTALTATSGTMKATGFGNTTVTAGGSTQPATSELVTWGLFKQFINLVFPVGILQMTTNGAVPNTFGGYITWTLWTPAGITQTNGGFYLKFTSTVGNVGNIQNTAVSAHTHGMSAVTTVPVSYTGGGAAKNPDGTNFGLVYSYPSASLNGNGNTYVQSIANSGQGAGISPVPLAHTHSIPAIGLTGQSDSTGSYNELEAAYVLIYKRTA